MAKGSHTLRAVNAEPGLHYFATAGSPSQLHSIDPKTGVIDTRSGFPIDLIGLTPVAITSPDGRYAYASGFYFEQSNLQRVDLQTGAVQQVASYPASVTVNAGAFTTDSTKYYSPNSDGTISIIDVATNTILQTLDTGAVTHNSAVSIGNRIYASDIDSGQITIINPSDDTFSSFTPMCPSSGKAISVVPDENDSNSIWVGCHNSNLLKIDKSSHSVLLSIATPNNIAGSSTVPGKDQIVVSSPTAPEVYIFDTNTGTLLRTIIIPAEGFAPVVTSDGSRILLPTPGSSFSNSTAVIIDTSDYSITNLTLSGISLGMFTGPDTVAEASVQFAVSGTLADTGENQGRTVMAASVVVVLSAGILLTLKRRLLS